MARHPTSDAALALFPFHSEAWRSLGRVQFLAGDDVAAAAALDRALELNRHDPEAHAFRGFVRFRQARFADALADFRLARAQHLVHVYLPLWE